MRRSKIFRRERSSSQSVWWTVCIIIIHWKCLVGPSERPFITQSEFRVPHWTTHCILLCLTYKYFYTSRRGNRYIYLMDDSISMSLWFIINPVKCILLCYLFEIVFLCPERRLGCGIACPDNAAINNIQLVLYSLRAFALQTRCIQETTFSIDKQR